MVRKIKSVTELAKYQVGDVAYCVAISQQISMPDLSKEDCWMIGHHPKTLYSRYHIWPYHSKLPKVSHCDFEMIVDLLTSKLIVEPFQVKEIHRSPNTGEFIYLNEIDQYMPEENLFDSDIVAAEECARIYKMITRWANVNGKEKQEKDR